MSTFFWRLGLPGVVALGSALNLVGMNQSRNVIQLRQRGTHIWQRIDDRWMIVHKHLTTDEYFTLVDNYFGSWNYG